MKFGKTAELHTVDFRFPEEHPESRRLLGGEEKADRALFIGCPAWTCKEWTGKIYPANARQQDFLHHYARQFQTIELNTTFYRTPDAATVARWNEMTPEGFRFCPKISRQISHLRRLQNVQLLTQEFCSAFLPMGNKLGPMFLQLPPNFTSREIDKLQSFVLSFPVGYKLAIEFRHESWFSDPEVFEHVTRLIASQNMLTVITDVAGRRDILHQRLTTDEIMVRFVGNNLHQSDYQRANDWVDRLQQWFASGLKKAWFFVHEPDDVLCPEMARYFAKRFNAQGNVKAKVPQFVPKNIQSSLF